MNQLTLKLGGTLVVLALVAGCKTSKDSVQKEPVRVEVQQVMTADSRQSLAYSGTIEESETIPLSFSSVGTVSQVFVSEGSVVKKGQLLATLDNTTYQNAYAMVHATEQQAEDAYNRLTPMHKNGNLPEVKYVEVETGLHQAKAAAAIAKKSLDDCNLYATTDGIVGKRYINPGMVALPNVTPITLVKISKVYARVPVSENEISSIQKGDKAAVIIGALGSREFYGTVEEIGVLADPLAHTYKIKIGIANHDWEIKPGMICNVTLNKVNEIPGLFVPSRAVLVDEQGRNFVYAVDQNKAVRKYVTTGKLLTNGVEIVNGLNDGEQIVVAGQQKLVGGSLIQVVNR
jgi:membrane fusion protein (multidrug efflux system)